MWWASVFKCCIKCTKFFLDVFFCVLACCFNAPAAENIICMMVTLMAVVMVMLVFIVIVVVVLILLRSRKTKAVGGVKGKNMKAAATKKTAAKKTTKQVKV